VRAILVVAGSALRILGLLVTALGIAKTWDAYSDDESILAPVTALPEKAFGQVRTMFASLLALVRGTRPDRRTDRTLSDTLTMSSTVTAMIAYGPLPPGTEKEGIARLDERTREMQLRFDSLHAQAASDIADLARIGDERERANQSQFTRLEHRDRDIATGGLRLAGLGLLLVVFGEALSLIAEVLPE
jgi:hypothetical protein